MNTRRPSKVFSLPQRLAEELNESGEFEFVLVLRADGNVDFLACPDDRHRQLLQINPDGDRYVYELPTKYKCEELKPSELEKGDVDKIQKNLTEGKVVKASMPIGFTVFENSGCVYPGGTCVCR